MNKNLLIIFMKPPVEGSVKTRIGKVIGHEKALNLYKSMVKDLWGNIRSESYDIIISYASDSTSDSDDSTYLITQLIQSQPHFFKQAGETIGDRMRNAFKYGFEKNYDKIALIGSDIVDLTFRDIENALTALEDFDFSIGPALDGGYYLIGFGKESFRDELFSNIHWSTSTVFDETIGVSTKLGLTAYLLDYKSDVDTIADLKRLQDLDTRSSTNPNLYAFIKTNHF